VARHQDDAGVGGRRPQRRQRVEGVGAGQRAVEQHDVRLLLPGGGDGGVAVPRLGHDLEPVVRAQRQADQEPIVRVVVDYEDPLGTHWNALLR